MLATSQKGEAAGRRNLRLALVLERLTGRTQDREYQSQAMRDGIEREEAARALYEVVAGRLVQTVGYVAHDSLMAGFSPDGFVGALDEGIVEAKAPQPAAHYEYLRTGQVPKDYRDQCLHGLWISGAKWCDWFSYQPDFDERLQMKLVRIHRNEAEIAEYEAKARAFLREVDLELQALKTMADTAGTLQEASA